MSVGSYRALLVANSTFPSDPHNLPELEGPRNDPSLLRDALCDDRYGLFPVDNVRLVVERTMAEVLQETEDLLRTASRSDTLLLYYSGHGKLDLTGELYLCARDSRADRLRSTAVKASDLRAMIDESAAATTVILLDCCHSGAFKGGELARSLAGRGRFVVTSCRTGELANDSHARNRASMFTHYVVEGMLGGAPDHDSDGLVGLDDLYGYVHARLAAEHRQIPQRSFAGTGDVPMARRPTATGPTTAAAPTTGTVAAVPVLDVSETLIELLDVDVDEELPPERVAVVNRGGGRLEWSAECAALWVTLTRDEHGILLHLHPRPGTNRANVHVRDDRTGTIRTVRVLVRTERPTGGRPAPAGVGAAAATSDHDSPPDMTSDHDSPADITATAATTDDATAAVGANPAGPEPAGAPPQEVPQAGEAAAHGPDRGPSRSRWAVAAMVAAAVAGSWLTLSGFAFLDEIDVNMDHEMFLRDWDLGPGLGTSVLGGLVLAGVGAIALLARWRRSLAGARSRFALGAALGLAATLGVERAGMAARWEQVWFYEDSSLSFGDLAILLNVAAVGLCWVALYVDRPAGVRIAWAPAWLPPAGAVSALLWGVGSGMDVYGDDAYVRNYFDVTPDGDAGGVVFMMVLLIAVLAAAPLVATRWSDRDGGRGLLAGAAAFVVLIEVIEVSTTLFGGSESRQGAGVLWMLLPAAAYVGAIVVGLRRTARERTRSGTVS